MSAITNFTKDAQIIGVDIHDHFELIVQVLSFNQFEYLENALMSVLNQAWDRRWRILIHDDASTDGSQEMIREFAVKYPEKIIAVLQQKNKFTRAYDISNLLQKLVSSDFTSRLDADDYFFTRDKLRKQVSYLRSHPNVSLTYHDYYILDERRKENFSVKFNQSQRCSWMKLLMGNPIATSTAVYRSGNAKCLPFQLGGFAIQDWPLWVFLETQGEIHYLKDIHSVYRVHDRNSFAEKSNRTFEKDLFALHGICAEMQKGFRKKIWLLMLYVYKIVRLLDRPTFGMSHKVLNTIRAHSIGFRRVTFPDTLNPH
jgi:glycosyltransferase involved in cell wall biosynthesis